MTIALILQANSHQVLSCECAETVRTAITRLAENRIGALPIVRDGEVVGIFSERDVIYKLTSDGEAVLDRPVQAA